MTGPYVSPTGQVMWTTRDLLDRPPRKVVMTNLVGLLRELRTDYSIALHALDTMRVLDTNTPHAERQVLLERQRHARMRLQQIDEAIAAHEPREEPECKWIWRNGEWVNDCRKCGPRPRSPVKSK